MSGEENTSDTTADEAVEAEEREWIVSLTAGCYATISVWAETEDDAREYARDELSRSDLQISDLEIDYIEVDEVKAAS